MFNDSNGVVILLVAVFVMLALGGITQTSRRPRQDTSFRRPRYNHSGYKSPRPTSDHDYSGFPYELQRNILTPAELRFFQVLRGVVSSRVLVCPKVRLGDVFRVNVDDQSRVIGYSNKINRKHVDFLLCDTETMRPLVGIELDDRSHEREDRQERDAFVDGVFTAANLPLLHIPTDRRGYSANNLNAQLSPYLDGSSTLQSVTKSPAAPRPQPAVSVLASPGQVVAGAPACPHCKSPMLLRTAKSGPNAGKQFWGCSNYPQCRGMARYS